MPCASSAAISGCRRSGLASRFPWIATREEFDLLNEKVTETPIQASLLMRLARGSFSPYLLGGPGWYKRKVEPSRARS